VLSVAIASRWKKLQDQSPSSLADPPLLNESCAKYILSVMILYMRQTTSPEHRLLHKTSFAVDSSFRDYEVLDVSLTTALSGSIPVILTHDESPPAVDSPTGTPTSSTARSHRTAAAAAPIPPNSWAYEKSHASQVKSPSSMNTLIAKFTGRIVYQLSVSNWPVVMFRLRTKIHYLAHTSEEKVDIVDMGLMAHSALDRVKLIQVLNGSRFANSPLSHFVLICLAAELSSLLVNMKRDVQVALSVHLRAAIWNWIDIFPAEFNEALRSRGCMEGAPERVFDLLYLVQSGSEKIMWPVLTVLNCISSERLSVDFQMNHFGTGFGNMGGGQRGYRKVCCFLPLTNHFFFC
jgi:hypothetical protein